jgi:hypothetical protein
MKNAIYKGNPAKKSFKSWFMLMLSILGLCVIALLDNGAVKYFENSYLLAFTISTFAVLTSSILFFVITLGGVNQSIKFLKEFWTEVKSDKKGWGLAFLFIFTMGLILSIVIGLMATNFSISQNLHFYIMRSIVYGFCSILTLLAFVETNKNLYESGIESVIIHATSLSFLDLILGAPVESAVVVFFWYLIMGFAILAKRKGFAMGIALFFYAVISCNLLCACEKYNIAGFTFVTEPATGLNETMGLLFGLLLLGMAYLAHYFYEYAYAYSLPMKEVVEKTKFAYQRTWGGKPLVIAELLPLLKKNRENIKVWTDAVISHEDYAKSRTMSCNESYYGIHGFSNGKWHCFDDGLLVHAETTSNREGRFRLNYRWPADRYLIKVIEKEKIYVGIFAVVKTLEEVQSYGKAYNFNAPPNVLSRWTKAPLNFRCQCALLYDISTGEEAYIRYDVIDHPDGFRRNLRGFYGGITLD